MSHFLRGTCWLLPLLTVVRDQTCSRACPFSSLINLLVNGLVAAVRCSAPGAQFFPASLVNSSLTGDSSRLRVRFASCPGCCARVEPQVAVHFRHLSNQNRSHDFWPSHPRPFLRRHLGRIFSAKRQGVHLPWCRVDLLSPAPLMSDILFHVGIACSPSVSHGVAQTVSQSTLRRRGSHKKPKRPIWVVHGRDPWPQFHEKTSERENKKRKGAGEGNKREILGSPPFKPPLPSCPDPSGPSGTHLFLRATLLGPTPFGPLKFWTNVSLD